MTAWYPLTERADVQAIVSGEYAPALGGGFVTGPLRLISSDVALLAPEHYPPNPLAQRVITELSAGQIGQPWRGYVALVQYEWDDSTGEWLWPGGMDAEWAERITAAVRDATDG